MRSNKIDIWLLNLTGEYTEINQYYRLLSPDELIRSNKFRFSKDKNEFIISRGFLRKVLSEYSAINPEDLKFIYSTNGKPYLEGKLSELLKFNLSHSGGFAIIAVNFRNEIGIDIELINDLDDRLSLAKNLFTASEQKYLTEKPDLDLDRFFEIWTRKESVIKALGNGLSVPLNKIDVTNGGVVHLDSTLLNMTSGQNELKLYDLKCPVNFKAALAVIGNKKELVYKN